MSPGWCARSRYGAARPASGGGGAEQALDRAHRLDDAAAGRRRGSGPSMRCDRAVARARSSGAKAARPRAREAQQALARVGGRRRPRDQAAGFEAAEDAAQIAGVEAEVAAEVGGGRRVAVGELVEHAHLGQRERAVEQVLAERRRSAGCRSG